MKNTKFIAAAALALAAGAASAAAIGTGTGTFSFTGTKDSSFFVTLGPGTYDFSSVIDGVNGLTLTNAYLAYDKNNTNSIDKFEKQSPTELTEVFGPLVLTQTTNIFIDVNTKLGKASGGLFNGTITITSAVPEPATTGMLLAGLGVIGFVGRRRKL